MCLSVLLYFQSLMKAIAVEPITPKEKDEQRNLNLKHQQLRLFCYRKRDSKLSWSLSFKSSQMSSQLHFLVRASHLDPLESSTLALEAGHPSTRITSHSCSSTNCYYCWEPLVSNRSSNRWTRPELSFFLEKWHFAWTAHLLDLSSLHWCSFDQNYPL